MKTESFSKERKPALKAEIRNLLTTQNRFSKVLITKEPKRAFYRKNTRG